MDAFATTAPPAVLSAVTCSAEEHDVDVYARLLRDLREALQEPPEFVFRAGKDPSDSGMAA